MMENNAVSIQPTTAPTELLEERVRKLEEAYNRHVKNDVIHSLDFAVRVQEFSGTDVVAETFFADKSRSKKLLTVENKYSAPGVKSAVIKTWLSGTKKGLKQIYDGTGNLIREETT
jgi:hypothetical protein